MIFHGCCKGDMNVIICFRATSQGLFDLLLVRLCQLFDCLFRQCFGIRPVFIAFVGGNCLRFLVFFVVIVRESFLSFEILVSKQSASFLGLYWFF